MLEMPKLIREWKEVRTFCPFHLTRLSFARYWQIQSNLGWKAELDQVPQVNDLEQYPMERLISRWAGMCIEVYHQSLYNNTNTIFFKRRDSLCALHAFILNLDSSYVKVSRDICTSNSPLRDFGSKWVWTPKTKPRYLHVSALHLTHPKPLHHGAETSWTYFYKLFHVGYCIGLNTRDHLLNFLSIRYPLIQSS